MEALLMHVHLFDANAPKRPTNLSLNRDLLERARASGINLSQTLEEALAAKLQAEWRAKWKAENQQAIDEFNQRIEAQGTFGDEFRRF
jgi:antitoxin CcdA